MKLSNSFTTEVLYLYGLLDKINHSIATAEWGSKYQIQLFPPIKISVLWQKKFIPAMNNYKTPVNYNTHSPVNKVKVLLG